MHALIMAGGRGTRFWPASRHHRPKQLLHVIGEKTLFQLTVDRVRQLMPPERIIVATGSDLMPEVTRQVPDIPLENFIAEPQGRNTAPCIGWAALHIAEKVGDDVMVVLPSDHFMRDDRRFLEVVAAATAFAAQGPHLVTLAIPPTYPETGFGYIQLGALETTSNNEPVYKVIKFHEKPDKQTAERFLLEKTYYWNSGIFIWKVSTILTQMKHHLPWLHEGLREMYRLLAANQNRQAEQTFLAFEPVSIDYGVMEKASSIYALPGDMGWSDVGSWSAIYDIHSKDEHANVFIGDVVDIDTRGCLVISPDKLVALIGLHNIVIVNTNDALLVCPRERAQEVRHIVETLKHQGRTSLL